MKLPGVNRSTFYLHYETVNDLLNESIEFMKREFSKEMTQNADAIVPKPCTCPEEELYLVTLAYLKPYLAYIHTAGDGNHAGEAMIRMI